MAAFERWRTGREELFEELTKVCDRIGADLESDRNEDKYFKRLQMEKVRELKEEAARVDGLEEQNSGLKRMQKEDAQKHQKLYQGLIAENNKLQEMNMTLQHRNNEGKSLIDTLLREEQERWDTQCNAGGGSGFDSDDQQPDLTPVPIEFRSSARKIELDGPNPVTRDTYRNLVVKYNALHENWADLKVARNLLDDSLREEKRKNRQYYTYVESQNKRIAKRDERIQKLDEEIESLRARLEEAKSRCDQRRNLTAATPQVLSPVLPQQHFRQSTSTEGDSEPVCINDAEDKSDTVKAEPIPDISSLSESPVVVSSRSVRRRKNPKDSTELKTVPRVKIEVATSSPIGLAAFKDLDTGESIDLDEIGEKVNTPKKRHRLLELSRRGMPSVTDAAQRDGSQGQDRRITSDTTVPESRCTPIHRVGPGRAGSALSSRSSNKKILPRTSEERPTKKRRMANDKDIGDLVEDGEVITFEANGPKIRQAPEVDSLLHGLLKHPSPPKPVLSDSLASTPLNPRARPRRPSPTAALIHEVHGLQRDNKERHLALMSSISSLEGRLRMSKKRLRPSLLTRTTGQPLEHGKPSATKRSQPPSNDERDESETHDPEFDPDDEPFRARPAHKLGLEHFKVNPNHNGGYKHAFTDVVRNQAERRCLPGCTKPDCCGNKFRALAEVTRDSGRPQTMSQEEEDQRLLEEFLGDNKHKLSHMTVDARNETLLQARTRHLANMHGRHRHAFERRTSPPGFWRADFPTTQEEMSDREKAAQVERELVAQRYEEAMRPGGAYMFRDE